MRDDPVKDAPQDVAQDVTQGAAEDVLGAAEDGSAKVFVVARVAFHRPPRFPWATREGRARQGRGAERCGGRCGGRATGRGAGLVFGAQAVRALLASPPPPPPPFCAAHAEIGAQLDSSVAFGSGCAGTSGGAVQSAGAFMLIVRRRHSLAPSPGVHTTATKRNIT